MMKNKITLGITSDKVVYRVLSALTIGFILTIITIFGFMVLLTDETYAADPDEGYVVVVFPGEDGTVRAISYTTGISRVGALRLAGWDVVEDGGSICAIDGVGCPASDCFCSDNWWASHYWHNNIWDGTYPPPPVSDGDILGFRWAEGFASNGWGPPQLPGPSYAAGQQALDWLRFQQSPVNGSYNDSVGNSVESMLSIGADRFDADDRRTSSISPSLLNYLQTDNYAANFAAANAGRAGKLAVALAGTSQDPQNFNGLNLVISLTNNYSATTGIFDEATLNQAWAMLGWRAAGQTIPVTATHHLAANALGNGGWEWGAGFGSDTNTTALALQALVAGGECLTSPNIIDGLDYLKTAQNDDGGFTYDPQSAWGTDSDTNSTAWVLQALHVLGEDPTGTEWSINSTNPISYLLSMQLPDGSFEWQTGYGTNQLATQQAIVPLLGQSFPLHMAPPDQSQCFISPPSQAAGDRQTWLPIIVKSSTN